MAYLIDTNVASELRKNHNAHPRVLAWQNTCSPPEIWISVISLMEIQLGVQKALKSDPVFSNVLNDWYHNSLIPAYSDRIISVDRAVAETRASLQAGRTLPHSDALIAATAKHLGLTIVTRNIKDFQGLGINLINPWEHPLD